MTSGSRLIDSAFTRTEGQGQVKTKYVIDPHELASRIYPTLKPLGLRYESGKWNGLYSPNSTIDMRRRYTKPEIEALVSLALRASLNDHDETDRPVTIALVREVLLALMGFLNPVAMSLVKGED